MNNQKQAKYGSLDHAEYGEQMAAVDAAMRLYFNSEDWIKARAEEFPALRRAYLG